MTLEETITYYQKVVDTVPKDRVPNVGRWCLDNHIKEVLVWLQDYRALKTENEELKRMLRLAVIDFQTTMREDKCRVCDLKGCGYDDICAWRYQDEAMKLLGGECEDVQENG